MVSLAWPNPDAPRSEVDLFVREKTPLPREPEPAHEAPAPENGPAIVCNGCEIVRVALNAPLGLCKRCRQGIGA